MQISLLCLIQNYVVKLRSFEIAMTINNSSRIVKLPSQYGSPNALNGFELRNNLERLVEASLKNQIIEKYPNSNLARGFWDNDIRSRLREFGKKSVYT